MPKVKIKSKASELREVFDSIVTNGLDFIEASVQDIDKRPKFSIAHFATGLELVLKARLFNEHWTLITADPHKATWANLTGGGVKTVGASRLCESIAAVTGKSLTKQAAVFKRAFDHRNRVLHFNAPPHPAATVAEQLAAWYHLHQLVTRDWASIFAAHLERFKVVETKLMDNRKYLEARFEALRETLAPLTAGGHVIDCPSCGFASAKLSNKDVDATSIQCEVCLADFTVAQWGCGHWHVVEDGKVAFDCPCGETHDISELVEKLDATAGMSPSEVSAHPGGTYHCGECFDFEPMVVFVEESNEYVCLSCGARFSSSGHTECEYCSTQWVGYDTDNSYFLGCEFCDGRGED